MSRFRYLLSLLTNLAVFNSFAYLAFARNIDALFLHFDGTYMLTDAREQLRFGQPLFEYTNNFLQSIGNVQFMQNARLLFFYWPIGWFSNVATAKIFCYLIAATMVFASAYCLARLLSQSHVVALAAGWILGFVSTPFVPMPFFYPIFSLTPSYVLIVVAPVVTFWLVHRAGRSPRLVMNGMYALALLIMVFYLLAAAPLLLPIYAPGMTVYAVMALCLARDRTELIRKLAVLGFVLVAASILRWPWYVLGLFLDTAPNLFPNDFTAVYHDEISVSILFHGKAIGPAGPRLVIAALIGALISLKWADRSARVAAWMVVVLVAVFLATGFVLSHMSHWIFPPPIYFEMAIWPLYAVFAAIVSIRLIDFVAAQFIHSSFWRIAPRKPYLIPSVASLVLVAVIVMRHTPHPINYPFPPKTTPVVAHLKSTIAIDTDSDFRGRILTTMPINPDGDDAWMQQFITTSDWALREGNDELSMGLWYYRIPTLFEYNQFITPEYHALVRRALQRPPIAHQRNITVISYPNGSVLKLLGVRYVLMPSPDASLGSVRATENRPGGSWELVELPQPNLATYSPTMIETRRSLASALDFVVDDRVDLTKQAVADDEIAGPLMPAHSSSLRMAGRDLHVTAESEGRTLMVVPLEFSHCIELRQNNPAAEDGPTLLRIDGLLTGIVFDRRLDTLLSFRIGPLHNPSCRWKDYRDVRAMLH